MAVEMGKAAVVAPPVSFEQVADEIRQWRARTGKTHYDLADEVGVSLSTILRLSGVKPVPEVAGWAVVRVRKVVAP